MLRKRDRRQNRIIISGANADLITTGVTDTTLTIPTDTTTALTVPTRNKGGRYLKTTDKKKKM